MGKLIRQIDRDELPASVLTIPEDLNPLSSGILMTHQACWIGDTADLKACRKGRRTGITWAEAHDDTLIAAASREAGGDNVFYIGDTKEKGLEWIGYIAHFAKFIEGHRPEIWEAEEEVEYEQDGKRIVEKYTAYVVKFASGYRCAALASRPAVIRGLQGVVVIDEAAFHVDVRGVIDACNALLIWGGKIRIISTHKGDLNPFNDLIKEIVAGETDYSLHTYSFDDAVENGLYERVCLVKGDTPSVEGKKSWYRKIRGSYGTRKAAMREELDVIPREGEGRYISLTLIENCMTKDYTVARWSPPEETFVDWPQSKRREIMKRWLDQELQPLLREFAETVAHRARAFGEDFAMRNDRTAIALGYTADDLVRHVPIIIELFACPYDQQEQVLFYLEGYLRPLQKGILDANGNGMVLAQKARQKFGAARIEELVANDSWYRDHSPRFRDAFESGTIRIPQDRDVRNDIALMETKDGVGKVPRNIRTDGTDASGGGKRHGDAAVALLNFHAATFGEIVAYDGYQGVPRDSLGGGGRRGDFMHAPPDDDIPDDDKWVKGAW